MALCAGCAFCLPVIVGVSIHDEVYVCMCVYACLSCDSSIFPYFARLSVPSGFAPQLPSRGIDISPRAFLVRAIAYEQAKQIFKDKILQMIHMLIHSIMAPALSELPRPRICFPIEGWERISIAAAFWLFPHRLAADYVTSTG